MNQTEESTKIIGKFAATLSLTEIGLGSLLHGLSLPFAGQFLSINQIAIMSRASFQTRSKTAALKISLISSILKSLSPAGKKLTPMLAILSQGFLYSSALSLFGLNYAGVFAATALSSSWAFLQPVLLIYVLFGKAFLEVLAYFTKDFRFIKNIDPKIILWLILATFLIKFTIAFFVSLKLIRMPEEKFLDLQEKLTVNIKQRNKKVYRSQLLNAFMDLCQPLFLFSFFLTALFLFQSQGSHVQIIWMLLRPLAVGLLLFYAIRIFPVENLALFLEKKGHGEISKALQHAIELVKKKRS